MRLFERTCQGLPPGSPTLSQGEIDTLLPELEGWRVVDGLKLAKEYSFKDFAKTLAFINQVGEVAEAEDHHPDFYFTYGKARLEIQTHSIGGLSENDFILAAKLDRL